MKSYVHPSVCPYREVLLKEHRNPVTPEPGQGPVTCLGCNIVIGVYPQRLVELLSGGRIK